MAYIRKNLRTLPLLLVLAMFVGELDFRLLPHETRLEYDVHDELYWRLRPNQVGFEWLANMTRKSPPIRVNSLGLRGPEVDVAAPGRFRVLAIGSSSALGSGVEDHETWTARLQELLRTCGVSADVMNGANPGWGPFQHAAFLEHEAAQYDPHAVIVMISPGDFGFVPKGSEAEKQAYLKQSKSRKRLLAVSPFLTYSLRKGEVLINRLRAAFQHWGKKAHASGQGARVGRRSGLTAEQIWERHGPYWVAVAERAREHRLATVFFVINVEDSPGMHDVAERLEQLSRNCVTLNVRVLELDSAAIPGILNVKDRISHIETHLRIPGDGHPNAKFHRVMAEAIVEAGVLLYP